MRYFGDRVFVFLLHGAALSAAPIHVENRDGRYILADTSGRERVIHGINLATMGHNGVDSSIVPIDVALYRNGRCPENDNKWYQPPICASDIEQLKARGFDAVRLLVHWAQIEPSPGKYSAKYFARLNQIIDWAEDNDVDVLLDFHQDNFANVSHACCADDGAPGWAWLADEIALTGEQKVEIALMKKLIPQLDWSGAEVDFYAFWHNVKTAATRRGLQEHYIQAVAHTVKATMNRRGVIGWEIMNEPLPGLDINLFDMAANLLYPFYTRVIQALTGVRDGLPSCACNVAGDLRLICPDEVSPISAACAYPDLGLHTDKLIVFEPMAVRNQLDVSVQWSRPFSEYRNLVYAPHTYTHSFTLWKKGPYSLSLTTALAESSRMHAAILVTEWGGGALEALAGIREWQERLMVNDLHWVWKQNNGGGWSLHHAIDGQNFTIRMDRLRTVSRIHPRYIAGELRSYTQANSTFSMLARCPPSNSSLFLAFTEVYFPSHFTECLHSSPGFVLQGAAHLAKLEHAKDGSVTGFISCDGEGEFQAMCGFQPGMSTVTSAFIV